MTAANVAVAVGAIVADGEGVCVGSNVGVDVLVALGTGVLVGVGVRGGEVSWQKSCVSGVFSSAAKARIHTVQTSAEISVIGVEIVSAA